MNKTNIAWTDYTWNPITGCSAVSEGCKNCYAKKVHERFYDTPFSDVVFHESRLTEPSRLKKPSMIFIGSMTDLFQELPDAKWIDGLILNEFVFKVLKVVIENPQHTFQILTKRPVNMRATMRAFYKHIATTSLNKKLLNGVIPNLWLGVTVENQKEAITRIPTLSLTQAAKRFVSIEPMLDEIDLEKIVFPGCYELNALNGKIKDLDPVFANQYMENNKTTKLDWVIVGGETGAKNQTRAMHPAWVEKIYLQSQKHGIPFFFKQWGSFKPKKKYIFENTQEFPQIKKDDLCVKIAV
jgi:protein gp37